MQQAPAPAPPPPPPPPPLPGLLHHAASHSAPGRQRAPVPDVPAAGPPNSVLVSLLVYDGWPFANHWEYFVASPTRPDVGVVLWAAGNVREDFALEIRRGWDLSVPSQRPDERVRLGWVPEGLFESLDRVFGTGVGDSGGGGGGQPDGGVVVVEGEPRCQFERIVLRVPAPEKTLRNVDVDDMDRRAKIMQRNCQTWVVESAELLVRERVFGQRVVDYLRATKQY